MNRTKQTRHRYLSTLSACLLLFFTAVQADDYRAARAELVASYQQADYAAMMVAASKALAARPGFPGGLFNLAMTQAMNDADDIFLGSIRTGALLCATQSLQS